MKERALFWTLNRLRSVCLCVVALRFPGLLGTSACGSPEVADRFAVEAQSAFGAQDYGKAVELLTKAIAEDAGNPELYANRGSCYDLLGRTAEAVRDFDTSLSKAIESGHDPKAKSLAGIVYNRGSAFAHAGKLPEAAADFEKTLTLDPEFPDARIDLAWILATAPEAALHDPKKALALIEQEAAQNSPVSADSRYARGGAGGQREFRRGGEAGKCSHRRSGEYRAAQALSGAAPAVRATKTVHGGSRAAGRWRRAGAVGALSRDYAKPTQAPA